MSAVVAYSCIPAVNHMHVYVCLFEIADLRHIYTCRVITYMHVSFMRDMLEVIHN